MTGNAVVDRPDPQAGAPRRPGTALLVVRAVVAMLILPAVVLFAAAGRLDWPMAWIYVIVLTAFTLGSRLVIFRKHPDLVAERAQALRKEDTKPWDRVLVPIVAIYGPMAVLLVAGLDKRNGWSPEVASGVQIAAMVVVAAAILFAAWAMAVNRFFSGTVRIQKDRGHTVVTDGPYRFVRHPGYSASVLVHFAAPLALGSLWALVPGVLVVSALVIRTALEDRTLQEELDGYRDYARRVRFRLLPGVW